MMAGHRRFTGRLPIASAIVLAVLSAPGPPVSGLQDPAGRPLMAAELWLHPVPDARVDPAFNRAVAELGEGRPERALTSFGAFLGDPVLGDYARLYTGRSELALKRFGAAVATARLLIEPRLHGALVEAAWWLLADAAEASADWPEAVRALRALTSLPSSSRQAEAHRRLGEAALQLKDTELARSALRTAYYDHPLSADGAAAGRALATLGTPAGTAAQDLARAERLYAGGRYAEARRMFEGVRPRVSGDERSLVDLRLAECDVHLKRYAAARAALEAYLEEPGDRRVEAEFYRLATLRELDRDAEYLAAVRAFADRHGSHPLVEVALNDLGTYYILTDDDDLAAGVFGEMFARFPLGVHADRAAWKAGWWAYRQRDFATAIRIFESAAGSLGRADYRPAWLYWAARAREHAGDRSAAFSTHRRVVTDYRNSFYGRQSLAALTRLTELGVAVATAASDPPITSWSVVAPGARPVNARLIQRLLAVGLYDDAILELRHVQRVQGPSPFLEATIGYALHRKGQWRLGITALRRAYPQFMAAGGERLPIELLKMIFPLDHWDLIKKYAAAHGLDPFLMAALMCQESTFQADVRSPANAWGLMQILPSTGRRYAQRLGIRPFTTARLTQPEVNIRIGMAYFADLRDQFDELADALAAYNAGENRVVRWRAERPDIPLEEFIDDIPFPETQHYVKRVLGTAEDYRILYAHLQPPARQVSGR